MEADVGTAGGSPLDSLTAKVEELGRVCAQLGQENAELRAQVLSLHGGTAGGTARHDAPGACGAYRYIVDRWPSAKPRSLSLRTR